MDETQEPGHMIREPMVEGIFYPADPILLREALQTLLIRNSTIRDTSRIIVSPHGSLDFSGSVMAAAFGSVGELKANRIIIVGPCLHSRQPRIFIPESTAFRTPLGVSTVDMEALDLLLDISTIIERNDVPHLQEHTIEVQLPFIQTLFDGVPIIPILLGTISDSVVKAAYAASAILIEELKDSLLIISANLTASADQHRAHQEALLILDLIRQGKPAEIVKCYTDGKLRSEGAAALALAACFADGREPVVLARSNSLSVHYDPTNTIEYAAITM